MKKKRKITLSGLIDGIFYVIYILLFIVTILDMFGIPIPFVDQFTIDANGQPVVQPLLKLLLLLFATVGIVVLNDKRELTKKVVAPIEHLDNLITTGNTGSANITLLKNKDDFYMFFTQELRSLEKGAEILVTSFDKNQGLSYYSGENKHIEAFMDDWSAKIQSGSISVKQLVHIYSRKEMEEVEERINNFKNCTNFSLSAFVGMPIRPYIDLVVINRTTVLLGFTNDLSSAYDTAFGVAIRGSDFADQFEKYFNIYWNDDCRVLKNKDGILTENVQFFKSLALNIHNYPDHKVYNEMVLRLIASNAAYKNLNRLITDIHKLSIVDAYGLPLKTASEKIERTYQDIHKRILNGDINIKPKDVQKEMSTLIASARMNILATSNEIDDDSYWTSKNGEEVFFQNIRGIADKRLSIERVFIITTAQADSLKEVIERQKNAGVTVRLIITDVVGASNLYKDFIIVDEKAVIEIEAGGSAKMCIGKDKVEEYKETFNMYRRQSATS